MREVIKFAGGLTCLALLLTGVGCGNAKDMQIQELQTRLNDAESENESLRARLAAAQREANQARQRALELQALLQEAQDRLAEIPEQERIAAPEGWQDTGTVAWTDIGDDILFESGKAVIKSGGKQKLQRVAEQIKSNYPDRQIWVVGHTDADPIRKSKWKDNLQLSLARAAAVTRQLLDLGIPAQKVVAGGQGEYNPKVPNDSAKNKQMNRRVQIVAVAMPEMYGGEIAVE